MVTMKVTSIIATFLLSIFLIGCQQSSNLPEVNKENCQEDSIMKIDDEKLRGSFRGKCAKISTFVESPKKSW